MSNTPAVPAGGERLAKVIARAGLCSRRDAEGWIKDGRVAVNGAVIRTPAFNISEKDEIKVDGRLLAERAGTRVWLYHKPAGLVVTEKDPEGRETIFDRLATEGLPRVLTVGRLDINTEGLLLLTNDGGLKRILELPATGWLRRYRVRAFGKVSQQQLDNLKNGIELEGIKYGPIEATFERETGDNVWLLVGLREGKNREVKNVLASLGLEVNRLIRISYGPFQLGDLAVGAVETVRAKVLRDQLGARLAREAGVDFESEMPERRKGEPEAEEAPQQRRDRPGRGPEFSRRPPRPAAEPERPTGKPRKIHFGDGRAPAEFVAKTYGAKKPFGDKPEGGKPGGGKPFAGKGDRPDRPPHAAGAGPRRDFKSGSKPDFKDRPKRPFKDGPRTDFKDRPKRDFADRPKREFGDRPKRAFGDAPRAERSDRPARPAGAPPKRDFKDRPKRPFSDGPRPERSDRPARPAGDRPRSPRPAGDRPRSSRPPSGAPAGARPPRPPGVGDRPRGPRPPGGAPRKPGAGSRPSRSAGDSPRSARPPGGPPRKPGGAPRKPGGAPRSTGPRKPRA